MCCIKKFLAFFYIFLTLLFSAQAYSDSCLDLEIDSQTSSGLEFHEAKYNVIASSDQKQGQERSPNPNITVIKSVKSENDRVHGGLSSGALVSIYRYYSNSDTIYINLSTYVLVFPFHFFG